MLLTVVHNIIVMIETYHVDAQYNLIFTTDPANLQHITVTDNLQFAVPDSLLLILPQNLET